MQKIDPERIFRSVSRDCSLFLLVDINQYSEPQNLLRQLEGLEVRHLFVGTPFSQLIIQSPRLVELSLKCTDLLNDVCRQLSGCIVASHLPIDKLNQDLGKMLLADHESDGKVYLRFFMPAMARVILQDSKHTHCWPNCSRLWLPDYRREHWDEFELNDINKLQPLSISSHTEQSLKAEHLTYHLARTKHWISKPIETVKQAMQSLALLAVLDSLTVRELNQWSEFMANNSELLKPASWFSLLHQPISKQEKWQRAIALNDRERELTHD